MQSIIIVRGQLCHWPLSLSRRLNFIVLFSCDLRVLGCSEFGVNSSCGIRATCRSSVLSAAELVSRLHLQVWLGSYAVARRSNKCGNPHLVAAAAKEEPPARGAIREQSEKQTEKVEAIIFLFPVCFA